MTISGYDSKDIDAMISVLEKCCTILDASADADWSNMGTEEIQTIFTREIASLKNIGRCDRAELTIIFSPTGALQEIALANGWGALYTDLAAQFDAILERFNAHLEHLRKSVAVKKNTKDI